MATPPAVTPSTQRLWPHSILCSAMSWTPTPLSATCARTRRVMPRPGIRSTKHERGRRWLRGSNRSVTETPWPKSLKIHNNARDLKTIPGPARDLRLLLFLSQKPHRLAHHDSQHHVNLARAAWKLSD